MRKGKWKLKLCARIMLIVILLSFWKIPVFATPPMEQQQNLNESEMKFYSDSEIDLLIDDLTEAAKEVIEQAAAEAAKAAMLTSLAREAAALREAQRWRMEAGAAKKAGVRNAIIAGAVCLLGGIVVGVGGTILMKN